MDALTRHRLQHDDMHPLEVFALLARCGEVTTEPWCEVRGRGVRVAAEALGPLATKAAGSLRHCVVDGLARATCSAAHRATRERWPDLTVWLPTRDGEIVGATGGASALAASSGWTWVDPEGDARRMLNALAIPRRLLGPG